MNDGKSFISFREAVFEGRLHDFGLDLIADLYFDAASEAAEAGLPVDAPSAGELADMIVEAGATQEQVDVFMEEIDVLAGDRMTAAWRGLSWLGEGTALGIDVVKGACDILAAAGPSSAAPVPSSKLTDRIRRLTASLLTHPSERPGTKAAAQAILKSVTDRLGEECHPPFLLKTRAARAESAIMLLSDYLEDPLFESSGLAEAVRRHDALTARIAEGTPRRQFG